MMKNRLLLFCGGVALSLPLQAADVTLTASDPLGTSSFETAGLWSNAAPPSAGNAYFTGEFTLRTPTTAPTGPFAGDALTLAPSTFDLSKAFMFKGPGYTATVNNFTINGGYLRHAEGTVTTFVLDGTLTIGPNGARTNLQGPVEIASLISGSGTLTLEAVANAANVLTLSNAANTYTGDIVNNGRFTSTGRLNFVIGANGVTNSVSGTGPDTTINGELFIDVTGASSDDGDSWSLVPATNKTIFLSDVTGPGGDWTLDGSTWVDPSNTYQFSETSGTLTVIPSDGASDDDHDLYTKNEELVAGTDPDDVFSSPDSDADGLADGFEVFYFGDYQTEDLFVIIGRQSGGDDADSDGYTNLEEANAGPTDPTDALFTPLDTDGDGLIDGWELAHFGDLDEAGSGDPDGDSATHAAEQLAGSDPNNIASTPTDTDGDGLADVEEVFQPYAADSQTLHFWHLDELEATSVNPAIDAGSEPVPLTSLAGGATLWQSSLPGFGTALDPSANFGTPNGGILSALPLAADATDDVTMTLAGPDGAFTFEGLVRLDFDPAAPPGTAEMQILSGENDDDANRIFQFRILPGTGGGLDIEFIAISLNGIGTDVYSFRTPLPSAADPDAPVQGAWFHAAVTYDGNEGGQDSLKIYWTRMEESRTQARLLLSDVLGEDLTAGTPDFAIGNEGRTNGGASNNMVGLVDEVRISSVARTATGFYFSGGADYDDWAGVQGVTGGPEDDDDGDGLSNDFERLFGLDATSASSVNPIVISVDPTAGTLSYTRRSISLTGAGYEIWTSTDLQDWSQDTGADQTVTSTTGEVETVQITLSPALLTTPKRFIQIRVN